MRLTPHTVSSVARQPSGVPVSIDMTDDQRKCLHDCAGGRGSDLRSVRCCEHELVDLHIICTLLVPFPHCYYGKQSER